jgi:hypothetical protein
MNEIDSVVGAQVNALMKLLEQSRETHCSSAQEQARLQAAELRQRARRLARERVRKAALEERGRLEHEIRMAQAEIDTLKRKGARARDVALIASGRSMLEDALAERWRDREARLGWAETALQEAAMVLLGREWILEHPADWPADERDRAIAFGHESCGAAVTAAPVDTLAMGLRIRSGGALVDMSIAGLLANTRAIEGELLAEFNHATRRETS